MNNGTTKEEVVRSFIESAEFTGIESAWGFSHVMTQLPSTGEGGTNPKPTEISDHRHELAYETIDNSNCQQYCSLCGLTTVVVPHSFHNNRCDLCGYTQ